MDYSGDEIEGLCFKTEQHSIQKGIKIYGEKGEQSAMKEMKNLAIKNECFGEIDYSSLTQDQKDRALPILMFMVLKRSGELKSRGVVNGSYERIHTDKSECTSPTPDFYAMKYIYATAAKEDRDVATIDLPGFFLQTEAEKDDYTIVKLTGAVALLLVECDER